MNPIAPPQPRALDELPQHHSTVRTWNLLRKGDKLSALFWYDQLKLRYQYAITRDFRPEPSWWRKKRIKAAIERLFEDVDEEIYFEEAFNKQVKGVEAEKKRELARSQKSGEDLEEVLSGYDKFTVEEEKKIHEMTQAAIRRLLTAEREKSLI
jgi:hypothetical protein